MNAELTLLVSEPEMPNVINFTFFSNKFRTYGYVLFT
jgi:hypothetical protein